VRETAEEIGVRIDADDRIPAGVMFRRSAEFRVDFYFSVSRWTGHPQICEPHKCTDVMKGRGLRSSWSPSGRLGVVHVNTTKEAPCV
jgi:8-oxo-dGTP pyrophosphatase MutT (NUDIX family)